MTASIRRTQREGFEMWDLVVDAKLMGSFWTENAARARRLELLATTASGRGEALPSFLEHLLAPAPTLSPSYEAWRSKSALARLIDDDMNPEWVEQERLEREAEEAMWMERALGEQSDQSASQS